MNTSSANAPFDSSDWVISVTNPRPQRQESESTVASDGDLYPYHPALQKPLLGGGPLTPDMSPKLGRRAYPGHVNRAEPLESVKEVRGWKHTFRQAAPIAFASACGVVLGFMIAWGVLPRPVAWAANTYWTYQEYYPASPPPTEVPQAYYLSKPLNNSCLLPNIAQISDSTKPQTFDACSFVIKSTDEVWNLRGDVEAAIEKYFHEDYVDAGSWGKRIVGKKALREAVLAEMRAFPDIQIHITDCVCRGNDVDGYKCAMPDVLTGTNTGPSAYGPATNNPAKWTGLVQSWVKRNPKTGQWQYYAEWGVHDEWSLIQQLGLNFARVPHPPANTEPINDCNPLLHTAHGKFALNKYDLSEQMMHDAERMPSS
jgi:hypothetical protein